MKKAMFVAVLLAAFMLVGGAVATTKYVITSSKQIKPGTVGLANLSASARNALAGQDGAAGSQGPAGAKGDTGATGANGSTGAKGDKGDQGTQGLKGDKGDPGLKGDTGTAGTNGTNGTDGAQGPKGDTGAQGPPGLSNVETMGPYPSVSDLSTFTDEGANSSNLFVGDNGASVQTAWVECPSGKVAIGGGFSRLRDVAEDDNNLNIVSSFPTQIENGQVVYNPISGDSAGDYQPNAWLVEGYNNGTTDLMVRPWVVCATAN